MINNKLLVPVERVERTILLVRGQKIILDADLAKLYGVTTKRLNQQVKRNSGRFPEDFMFRLTQKEKDEVVANCNHLSRIKFSPALPHAFTEHGAIIPVDKKAFLWHSLFANRERRIRNDFKTARCPRHVETCDIEAIQLVL
jgi:hypothetical protein